MVHLSSSLSLAICISSVVSAEIGKRGIIPVHKGSSGAPITAKHIINRDLSRIAHYNGKSVRPSLSERANHGTATNKDGLYVAAVKVCDQTFNLIVDTGSANLWVGGDTKVNNGTSSCGTSAGHEFSVTYGSGSVSGVEHVGSVSYGGCTVSSQSYGVASETEGFSGVDGIIGLGPVGLTNGTVATTDTVPTFMNNLKSQGLIATETIGIYFAPLSGSDTDEANGELSLGDIDNAKFKGPLTYFPTTTVQPYSGYWGIRVASMTFGSTSLLRSANAIVDTGTTLIYIPTPAYNSFLNAADGKTDSATGLARFTNKPTGIFTFRIGTVSYKLTPEQYLVPKAQYEYYSLSSGAYYSWIGNGGANDDKSVNFIIGQKFLENYYSVYDATNSRVGFAMRA